MSQAETIWPPQQPLSLLQPAERFASIKPEKGYRILLPYMQEQQQRAEQAYQEAERPLTAEEHQDLMYQLSRSQYEQGGWLEAFLDRRNGKQRPQLMQPGRFSDIIAGLDGLLVVAKHGDEDSAPVDLGGVNLLVAYHGGERLQSHHVPVERTTGNYEMFARMHMPPTYWEDAQAHVAAGRPVLTTTTSGTGAILAMPSTNGKEAHLYRIAKSP